MTEPPRLAGLRFRRGESVRIEAILLERLDDAVWRARIRPAAAVATGDRLRFGESRESTACLLGFVDADVAAQSGEEAVLAFHFAGAALDEALERLRR